MISKTAIVDGITMRWDESGEGIPVVLIHGIPTSPALWRHVAQRMLATLGLLRARISPVASIYIIRFMLCLRFHSSINGSAERPDPQHPPSR